MRRALFFIVVIVFATSSFASIPRASMLDRTSEDASAFAASLLETRIRASEVLAPFERPTESERTRALRQAYEHPSTTNSSGLRCFLSADAALALKRAIKQPQSWNRYSYVVNNPINRIDPDGRVDDAIGPAMMLDCQLNDCRADWETDRKVASFGLSIMPLRIGDAYDVVSAATGRDHIGGEQLGTFARLAGLLPFVGAGTVQRIIKAVNLPGWKNVAIDMAHIIARHTPGGAQTSERATKFVGMSEKQIEKAVRQAYRYGKQVGSQGDRVRVVGEYDGLRIEMWVNKKTKTIETAYPLQ